MNAITRNSIFNQGSNPLKLQPRPQGPPREKLPPKDLSSGASHAEGPGDEVVETINI